MKRLINLMIMVLGAFFLSSCSTTGSMLEGSAGYGYYDNVYSHGYPNYYSAYGANPYLYPRTRIIHNNVIVLPEQKNVRSREQVRRKESVSQNSRRTITPNEPNQRVNRSAIPSRRGSSVAPTSRSNSPAPMRSSSPRSRRGE